MRSYMIKVMAWSGSWHDQGHGNRSRVHRNGPIVQIAWRVSEKFTLPTAVRGMVQGNPWLWAVSVYGTELASFLTMGMDSMDIANRELPVPMGIRVTGLWRGLRCAVLAALAMAGLATAAQAGPNLVQNGT